jgi:phospholipase C
MYFYAGTSNGITGNPQSVVAPYRFDDPGVMPSFLLTDLLEQHDVAWKSYSDDFAWLRFFPGRQSGVFANRIQNMGRFFRDCERGKLPSFAYVDPNFTDLGPDRNSTDDLPPCDVRQAQRGVREVYEALRRSPNWPHTLFIVTYDEHGGFYDHVPAQPVFDTLEGHFRRSGARVPALIASPYVPRGGVSKTVFDHTSVARTVLKRFLPGKHLSLREQQARSLAGTLTAATPRLSAPAAPAVAAPAARAGRPPSDLARMVAAFRERERAAAI